MPAHKSSDFKLAAVQFYIRCRNQAETCRTFGCSERSLMRWHARSSIEETVDRHSRTCVARKMKKQHVEFLKAYTQTHPDITIKELHLKLAERFPALSITRVHVGNVMRDNNISYKRKTRSVSPPSETLTPNHVDRFFDRIQNTNTENIICIGQTYFHAPLPRRHCRSQLGQTCNSKLANQNSVQYLGIFAITHKKCLASEVYDATQREDSCLLAFMDHHLSNYANKLFLLEMQRDESSSEVLQKLNGQGTAMFVNPQLHYAYASKYFLIDVKTKIYLNDMSSCGTLARSFKQCARRISQQKYQLYFQRAFDRHGGARYEGKKSTMWKPQTSVKYQ